MFLVKKFIQLFKRKSSFSNAYTNILKMEARDVSSIFLIKNRKTGQKFICKKSKNNYNTKGEIFTLKSIQNPKIINLIDYYYSNKYVRLILPYYKYGDLFDYISKKLPFNEANANIIFKEMLECVKACHSNDLIHLDIKPENFLVKSIIPFKLVIIDLEYSKIFHSKDILSTCNSPCGSIPYIAPELYHFQYGFCSDVWSLGSCLHVLVTTKYIIDDNNKFNLKLDSCSPKLQYLLKKILNKNPYERYTLKDIEKDSWYNSFK